MVALFESEWFKTRPKVIQDLCRQFPPESEVRIIGTGQIAYIYSYFEDGTLSVIVDAKRSFEEVGRVSAFGTEKSYRVFGLKPKALEKIEG